MRYLRWFKSIITIQQIQLLYSKKYSKRYSKGIVGFCKRSGINGLNGIRVEGMTVEGGRNDCGRWKE